MVINSLSKETREYAKIGSTNAEMIRLLAEEDLAEGTVVLADFQTAGKGQGGNAWHSEKGKNLLFSILLKPRFLAPGKAFHLSRIVSLAFVELLGIQGINPLIKWPNDILVKDRKLCGILIENSITGNKLDYSVAGVGLNVNQEHFSPEIPAPTSLFLEKGCHFDRNMLLAEFRERLNSWYRALIAGHELRIMEAYHNYLYRLHEMADFSDGKTIFRGSISGVHPEGSLEVRRENGVLARYGFGEIGFL